MSIENNNSNSEYDEVFLASIGREPEDDDLYEEEQEEIFDDSASDEEDEDGDPSLAGVENYE